MRCPGRLSAALESLHSYQELALLQDGVTFPDMTVLAEDKDRGKLISIHLFLQ